jgi:hypothetical protein
LWGKIVNIIQPTGTYSMYTIHNYFDGTITNCAKHDLVKGMDDFLFEEILVLSVATGILSIKFAMSCGRSISGERRAGDKFRSFTKDSMVVEILI